MSSLSLSPESCLCRASSAPWLDVYDAAREPGDVTAGPTVATDLGRRSDAARPPAAGGTVPVAVFKG